MEWNRCSYEAWETPGGWYYILEGSDTKGPFPTERSAMAQLQDQIDNVNRARKHNPRLTSKEIAQELEKQGFLDLTADQIEVRIQDRIAQKQLEAQGDTDGTK